MRLRELRFLTALIIVSGALFTASKGWSIAHFAAVRTNLGTPGYQGEPVRAWASIPGLTSMALEASLIEVNSPADAAAAQTRSNQLTQIVSVKPLSSMHWLSLAGARLVTGQSVDRVFAALSLSALTGPNEGYVMLRRGIFGLLQWENLPSNVRTAVISDLAVPTVTSIVPDRDAATIKTLLGMKSAATREEIAQLLVAQGLTPANLARIGL
jgi:hypothetical protein